MLKIFFYIVNLIFFTLYIFPGSILGFFMYNNIYRQPQFTDNLSFSFFEFSSNHIYAFFFISIFGLYIFFKDNKKKIIAYLFFISVNLELLHIIIPNRSFQFADINGNLLGIVFALTLFYAYNFKKKIFN